MVSLVKVTAIRFALPRITVLVLYWWSHATCSLIKLRFVQCTLLPIRSVDNWSTFFEAAFSGAETQLFEF